MEEIEKIKRKKKINDQDKQQPGTIQDLIRKYDLDNVKEDDYLDYLADYLNKDLTNKEQRVSDLESRWGLSVSNVDLNDYTKAGLYYFGTDCTNAPANWVRVLVMGSEYSTDISQIASGIGSNIVYVRVKNNGNWGNWERLASYDLNTLATYGNNVDPNTTLEPLLLTAHANGPVSGRFFYIKTVFFSKISTYSSRTQLALGYITNEIFVRNYYNGTWSNWSKFLGDVAYFEGDTTTIDENGLYYASGNATNTPLAGYSFYIQSIKYNSSYKCQIAYRVADARQNQTLYVRQCYSGNWKAWHEVPQCLYGGIVNCNDMKIPGQYGIYQSTNAPDQSIGVLEVVKYSNDWILQRFTIIKEKPITWERSWHSGNTWGAWLQTTMSEGTWTPTISTLEGATPTVSYTSRRGSYKRIGNMVFISFYLRGSISALNGTYNYTMISGLPFTVKSVALGENGLQNGIIYNCTTNTTNLGIYPIGTTKYLRIQTGYGTGAAVWKVTPSGGYFELGASGWYEIG